MNNRRVNGDHKMAEVMGMWTMPFISEKGASPKSMVVNAGIEEEGSDSTPMGF
jgi:hypothetical protein